MHISSLGMNESIWNKYRIDDPYLHEGSHLIAGMKRYCLETLVDGRKVTLGLYEYKGKEVLKAWGYKDEEHCSYHAIKTHGTWSEVIEGCPDFKVLDTGFSLTHKKLHTWVDDEYKEEEVPMTCCVAEEPRTISLYAPLIIAVLTSFFLGGVITTFQMLSIEMFLMNSMGVFITILGLLKLRNVGKFALMFRQYDPIAKRIPTYAKLYPYLEIGIGLFILLQLFTLLIQLAVIAVYTVTTIGIVSSLNKGKNLECGCLGSSVKLPLSKVTIFENLVMILMSLYTLSTFVH